jgi:hypothetical protein
MSLPGRRMTYAICCAAVLLLPLPCAACSVAELCLLVAALHVERKAIKPSAATLTISIYPSSHCHFINHSAHTATSPSVLLLLSTLPVCHSPFPGITSLCCTQNSVNSLPSIALRALNRSRTPSSLVPLPLCCIATSSSSTLHSLACYARQRCVNLGWWIGNLRGFDCVLRGRRLRIACAMLAGWWCRSGLEIGRSRRAGSRDR